MKKNYKFELENKDVIRLLVKLRGDQLNKVNFYGLTVSKNSICFEIQNTQHTRIMRALRGLTKFGFQ